MNNYDNLHSSDLESGLYDKNYKKLKKQVKHRFYNSIDKKGFTEINLDEDDNVYDEQPKKCCETTYKARYFCDDFCVIV